MSIIKKQKIGFLLLILFTINYCTLFPNYENHNTIENSQIPIASDYDIQWADTAALTKSCIVQSNKKGCDISMDVTTGIRLLYGVKTITLKSIAYTGSDYLCERYSHTGELIPTADVATIHDGSSITVSGWITETPITISGKFGTEEPHSMPIYCYLCNNTEDIRYWYNTLGNELSLGLNVGNSSIVNLVYSEYEAAGMVRLEYELEPLFIINSSYYNYQNIRTEFYLPRLTNWSYDVVDYTDAYYFEWAEQSIESAVFNFWQYKIRIYDRSNNQLIFEDLSMQNFTIKRTINIDSLRVQNNADEPIRTEMVENQHYKGTYSFNDDIVNQKPASLSFNSASQNYIVNEYQNHQKVLKIGAQSANWVGNYFTFSSQTVGSIDLWIYIPSSRSSDFRLYNRFYIVFDTNGYIRMYNNTNLISLGLYADQWVQLHIEFTSNNATLYIDGILKAFKFTNLNGNFGSITQLWLGHNLITTDSIYVDAIDFSWSGSYYLNRNCELNTSAELYNCNAFPNWNTTASPLCIATNLTLQTNPYANSLSNFTSANYLYRIADLYNNTLEISSLNASQNEIIYNPPNIREIFVSLANQRGDYLPWENFQFRINGTQIYENRFYREIGVSVSIEIYTRFNKSVTNYTHTVDRDSNYIPLTITQHSLKLYNQQAQFTYTNVSFDTNYPSEYMPESWSEWLAPGEITEYLLSQGHYIVNITEYETSTSTLYSYYLTGDDILLIQSQNTIYNILQNIMNVNSTIGNQITNVQIDLTNQNSNINNTILNIEINLNSTNSSLNSLLVNQNVAINNLGSDINTLYSFTNTTLFNLNTSIGIEFLSTQTLVQNVGTNLTLAVLQISNELLAVNSSFHMSMIDLNTNITQQTNNISNQVITLNNDLWLLNNTIMNAVQNLQSGVYLVNNSIYTAVNNISIDLFLMNNTIAGNLSTMFQMSPELTAIYTNTWFSENLTWDPNPDNVRNQTEIYNIVNKYRNESAILQIEYQNLIKELVLTGNEPINQMMLDYQQYNMSYRVLSLDKKTELEEWKPIDNSTISFGYWDDEYPETDVKVQQNITSADFIVISVILILCVLGYIAIVKNMGPITKSSKIKINEKRRDPTMESYDPLGALDRRKEKINRW